ncbi:MAG: hypothetical protein ACW9W3_02440 [Candidatus Nitrosopumilus sp. bin_68KS]
MREINLGLVLSTSFQGKRLIALEKKWDDFFIDDIITFQIRIDKNKNFVLVGPQVRLQPTKRNQQYSEEASINENNL